MSASQPLKRLIRKRRFVTEHPKGKCEDGAPIVLIFQQTGFYGKVTGGK